jgi:hypothetical protein
MFDNSQFFSGGAAGFYDFPLEQSLRFNDDDSAYLEWTPDSNPTTAGVFTFSFWFKLSNPSSPATILYPYTDSNNFGQVALSSNQLSVYSAIGGSAKVNVKTTAVLRDYSAWYHAVIKFNSTSGNEEIKIYLNGVNQSLTTTTAMTAHTPKYAANGVDHYFGSNFNQSGLFDGYLAEVNFIDGTALDADSFGELKNGVWIPKDSSGLAYGTNGFRLSFADDAEVEAFNTVLYEGNGATTTSTQSVTGVGFSPDLVWIKNRDNTTSNSLYDTIRGADVTLRTNTTDKDFDYGNTLLSFDSDGFTVGNYSHVNGNGLSHVAWCWKAGGAPTVDNSAGAGSVPTAGSVKIDGVNSTSALAGTISATRLSASTTYGFSIVKWSGNQTSGATVGHELGASPSLIITKCTSHATSWVVGIGGLSGFGVNDYLTLQTTGAKNSSSTFYQAYGTDTFTVGVSSADEMNKTSRDYISYVWAEKSGYSKFDSYSGATGEITVYTTDDGTSSGTNPFKPAFVLLKRTDSDPGDAYWVIFDNTRDVEGDNGRHLFANLTATESDSSSRKITFNDNGFTIPASASADASVNAGSGTYIYAAFADTREAAFWLDQTSNDNDWQPVNLDHNDTLADSPTDNFCTLNPLFTGNGAQLADGNLRVTLQNGTAGWTSCATTMALPETGKYYAEFTVVNYVNGYMGLGFYLDGQTQLQGNTSSTGANDANWWSQYGHDANWYNGGSTTSGAETWSSGTLMLAHDADTGKVWWGRNGSWFNSGNPSTGANAPFTITRNGRNLYMVVEGYNGVIWEANFGQQPFKYDPPA